MAATKSTAKIDVSNHVLVPKHQKVSEREKQQLLKNYGIEGAELPRINKNDPAVSQLDAKPGDIIKVTRASPTAGTSVFYRVVFSA